MNQFKIGKVTIPNQLVLAPMDGINCAAFRLLCKEHGAGLIYTAMVDCDKFIDMLKANKGNEKQTIRQVINPQEEERPLTIQIVGSDKENLSQTASILSKTADIIDFNIGCCEGDILGKKAGAYFMKHPDMLSKTIPYILDNSKPPVTCKLRSGWDEKSINAIEIAKMLEAIGIKGLAVHPRTRKQGYRGRADWKIIKNIKQNVEIPVIGNGDVTKPHQAVTMLGQTKCDAVMVGRAAIGNPFIFSNILNLIKTGEQQDEPSPQERHNCFVKFLELYKQKEAKSRFSEIIDHACWFAKGMEDSSNLKKRLRQCKTENHLQKVWYSSIYPDYSYFA